MHSVEVNLAGKQDMSQLHAATCLMMTRFINGHHCTELLQQRQAHQPTSIYH